MTVTPAPSPGVWPVDDEVAAIEQKIAELQRAADQAQTNSSLAASEVAIAQKAIRDLTTAKAEIQEKGRLWDREAELQRALAERKAVADRVRLALAAGGGLAAQRKTDLETALKAKAGIAESGNLDAVFQAADGIDKASSTADQTAESALKTAREALEQAELDYTRKARAAEARWSELQHSARILEELFNRAQQRLTAANALTAGLSAPTGSPPPLNPAAAEAGLAWKDFTDAFDALTKSTEIPAGASQDRGHTAAVGAWETARDAARNALAVLLKAQQSLAEAQRLQEQRQVSRPDRSASERQAALAKVREALSPPSTPAPAPAPSPGPAPAPGP
jgi:hypothetical protein